MKAEMANFGAKLCPMYPKAAGFSELCAVNFYWGLFLHPFFKSALST
jgi:hypothetical protein